MKSRVFGMFAVLVLPTLACSVMGTSTPARSAPTFTPIPSFTVPTASGLSSTGLTMQSSSFEEAGTEPPYTIKAQIPYLQGFDDVRIQNFNTYLKQIVLNEIDLFKTGTLAYATTPPIVNGSTLEIQYNVLGQRGNIWSIQFLFYFYADGAAHPGQTSALQCRPGTAGGGR